MAKCTFTKRNGDECGGFAVGPLGGCYQHDPAYELDRKRDARRNGKRGGAASIRALTTSHACSRASKTWPTRC